MFLPCSFKHLAVAALLAVAGLAAYGDDNIQTKTFDWCVLTCPKSIAVGVPFEVKIEVKNQMVKSGRRKFGCIMGDNVKTGINVSIMPGRSIYPNAYVDAASVVKNTIYTE